MPILAHLDLDAFFAAVEELEDPSLRTQPLVVGGNPQGRGVVATANYVARRFGIRSAMSSAEALRRCPDVVFVRPRHALYRQYSEAVWSAIREVVPRVEQVGIDEGYLDLGTVVTAFTGARAVAEAVQTSIRAATSLSCSLGVSTSKVVCKVASERRKPGGITVVPPGKEARFLAPFPVRALPGVGPKAELRLAAAGVKTIGDLAALGDTELRVVLPGTIGPLLRDRARGIDPRDLELEVERVSISVEETFERDISDRSAPPRRDRAHGRRGRGRARAEAALGADGDREAPVLGLLDQKPLDDARGPDRRGRPDRRARLPAARPRAPGPPGRATARRGRRLRALGVPAADVDERGGQASA